MFATALLCDSYGKFSAWVPFWTCESDDSDMANFVGSADFLA